MTESLFPEIPDPEPAPVVKLSAGRKRTIRNNALVEMGMNPLFGTRGPDGQTCGTCGHLRRQGGVAGHYLKCALKHTGGPGTDLRKSWPACSHWREATT